MAYVDRPGDMNDSKALEIKTKSIEQTLVPLVTQITTLVNHKEKQRVSEKTCQAIERVGQAVRLAVSKFVSVGEALGKENLDIQDELHEACSEAQVAGNNIARLTDTNSWLASTTQNSTDKNSMIKAARGLLSAVTKVLLLADRVVIKQIIVAEQKVKKSLNKLETVQNFTEFVQLFSQFGKEMVELAHLTGDRQNDLKDERIRVQMAAARGVLEKSTMMLLTSCKTCIRHPDCQSAQDNCTGVFRMMRKAFQMLDEVLLDSSSMSVLVKPKNIYNLLHTLSDVIETSKVTQAESNTQDKLVTTLSLVVDATQDFTDSAYTQHEQRERILKLLSKAKLDVNHLVQVGKRIEQGNAARYEEELDTSVYKAIKTVDDVKKQLQMTALSQAEEIFRSRDQDELTSKLKEAATFGQIDRVQSSAEKFMQYSEQLQEACKLMRHVASKPPVAIGLENAENNMIKLAPQLVTAFSTFAINPTSKIAKENVDVFSNTWQWQVKEINMIMKEITDTCTGRANQKHVYLSLPRPGKHGTTMKSSRPVKLDAEEQARIAKLGLELKLMTSELDVETDKWEDAENDILKRAKNMSSMAYSMYLFTRGEGPLKTTQDLFKQAEYFAEEGNKLFRVLKDFNSMIPEGGLLPDQLVHHLQSLPSLCQQLHYTTKSPSLGKIQTFAKVNGSIQETKNLLASISQMLPLCNTLVVKYNIRTPHSTHPIWRHGGPVMETRSNGDDSDSAASVLSTKSDGSLLRNVKTIANIDAFDRI
ncbi:alpha-catulin-like [Antedon mediterranea]|uniref:alpha-catulin-like n=1 Tax=Antedon mediterranea TaxID=105859 RepID=UPI003AF47007